MSRRMEYFAIGALVGLAIGVVVGILFAPTSGSNARRRLAEEARRAADVAKSVAERAEDAAEAITGRVDHYLGRDEEAAWRKVREIRAGVDRYTQTHVVAE